MKLTIEQERHIEEIVHKKGIKIQTLRDDIIDHLCCVVESKLGKEKSFEQLLEIALKDLAPNGLIEIQNETIFLLNSKKIIIMKKIMYSIGLIGAITLTAGVIFKLLYLPYGYELFSFGFILLLLIFIPMLAFDRYKLAISKAISEKMKFLFGVISAIIVGLSGVFKLYHLQGANWLLILGAFIFAFGFLPFLFFTMYKKSVS